MKAYAMSFDGALLGRGFWLYVWRITDGKRSVLYVGRTGDSSSPHASSPFNRIGQHLEYEEWDWLREHAPAVSWWRDWDKCERLAAALALRFEQQHAQLETVFSILRGRAAIRKVASVLDDDRDTRPYLKSLRKAAEASPGIGTREQRDALSED